VRKKRGRNGGGNESNLGLQLIPLFIAEMAIGALNGPLNHTKIYRRYYK
jgi:hypothetical protein